MGVPEHQLWKDYSDASKAMAEVVATSVWPLPALYFAALNPQLAGKLDWLAGLN